MGKTHTRAKAHVLNNRVAEIDAYVKAQGVEDETLAAAIKYAQWPAAAEYRLLASAGIRVDEISFDDLEPFLGRGRMPSLQSVLLSDLLDMNKQSRAGGLVAATGRRIWMRSVRTDGLGAAANL